MRSSRPPVLATWLAARLVSGDHAESLIGDLMEQYSRGRSPAWYWRQAIGAVFTSFVGQLRRHALTAAWICAFGLSVPQIYMFTVRPRWIARLDAWYPALINWLLEMDLDGIRLVVYRLQLNFLTTRVAYCSFVAVTAWMLSRVHARHRGMVVTLFIATQVGPCLLYLRTGVSDWLHDPLNPIRFFGLLWYSMFAFVAVPASILLGARAGRSRRVA